MLLGVALRISKDAALDTAQRQPVERNRMRGLEYCPNALEKADRRVLFFVVASDGNMTQAQAVISRLNDDLKTEKIIL